MCAFLLSSGRVLVSNNLTTMSDSGSATADAHSFRSIGWITSGPGDMSVVSFISFFRTASLLKSTVPSSHIGLEADGLGRFYFYGRVET